MTFIIGFGLGVAVNHFWPEIKADVITLRQKFKDWMDK